MEGGGKSSEYKKGLWTVEEDGILMDYIRVHGKGKWNRVNKLTGLKRCGKSCRLRWMNYLSPNVKRGDFSEEEDDLIIRLHNLLGNRWSLIAGRVPGRTDNQVKNHWNTHLSKKLGVNHVINNNNHKPIKTKAKTRTSLPTFSVLSQQQQQIKESSCIPSDQSQSSNSDQDHDHDHIHHHHDQLHTSLPNSNIGDHHHHYEAASVVCDDKAVIIKDNVVVGSKSAVGFSGMWEAMMSNNYESSFWLYNDHGLDDLYHPYFMDPILDDDYNSLKYVSDGL